MRTVHGRRSIPRVLYAGVPAPGHAPGEALAAELQAHVKAAIAPYKYPREVEFADALPKTATGKLQRYALREG